MNETIVKTEKLTELKNLVSEIEDLRKELKNSENKYSIFMDIKLKNKQLYKLIKSL